jgi:hypothetical protein
LEQAIV